MNICLDAHYCGSPGSVGSLSRYFALPADMAPHIPASLSWEEAGSIQPLAIGVNIARRVDLRAHQTLAVVGTGPIGLITGAVARAYGLSKVVGFDVNPKRVAFAQAYKDPAGRPVFDHVFLVPELPTTLAQNGNGNGNGSGAHDDEHEDTPVGDIKYEAAKRNAAEYIAQAGVDREGFERVVEASGAEDGGMLGVALAQMGATYLAVGLGHHQTNRFPTLAVTNKELDVKGESWSPFEALTHRHYALHRALLPERDRPARPQRSRPQAAHHQGRPAVQEQGGVRRRRERRRDQGHHQEPGDVMHVTSEFYFLLGCLEGWRQLCLRSFTAHKLWQVHQALLGAVV